MGVARVIRVLRSIHGWPVIENPSDKRLRLFQIPGVSRRSMRLRADIGAYLVAFVSEYHETIAPIDLGTFDDWSWSPLRPGRASSAISDHCAGVAVDLNATKEGAQNRAINGKWWKQPVTAAKLARLRRVYKLLEWGGDYKNFYDPMHWTFKQGVTEADVLAEMRRLGITPNGVRTLSWRGKLLKAA